MEEPAGRAEYWRLQSSKCRLAAARLTDARARESLLFTAHCYEALAERTERLERRSRVREFWLLDRRDDAAVKEQRRTPFGRDPRR